MGFILNGGKKQAKKAAAAALESANKQAANDRILAVGAQQSRETLIAQNAASQRASELLSKPQGKVDVQLAPDPAIAEIDPATGRRRTTRSTYLSKKAPGSGIRI